MDDLISRAAAIDVARKHPVKEVTPAYRLIDKAEVMTELMMLPSAQPDYTELKREFIRMASYIDVLLECSDVQKETLIGFISRLAEFMPWTERD